MDKEVEDLDAEAGNAPSAGADPGSRWTAGCLTALMARHGIPPRQQAAVVAQVADMSISQARRKLRGAVWLFNEVLALTRHFGETLDQVFAHPVLLAPERATAATALSSSLTSAYATTEPARFLADGLRLTCRIQLGPIDNAPSLANNSGGALLACRDNAGGWVVGPPERLAEAHLSGPRYRVDLVLISSSNHLSRARIAVLDDDASSADALTDWFTEAGYQAQAFTSVDQLLSLPLSSHDAFVVDLVLAGGQTSQPLVERIRTERPLAPVVLLTGQLRGVPGTEATLTTMLRTLGVTFFEKPVRPAVLTAAIQSGLDRLPGTADAHG